MKVLLSAYACEPGKGSEPGVGWNWALSLAKRGHEIWVLTLSSNVAAIEKAFGGLSQVDREHLHFIYYDLPRWAAWWHKGERGVYLHYFLWQLGAYLAAKRWHAQERFALVHHVTFVSVRQPSFMGNLGIPFIFGPVGGGEHTPWHLRTGYNWRGWLKDALRDFANTMVKFDPLMQRTFQQAQHIYTTSEQTRDLIPPRYWQKTTVQLGIASEPVSGARTPQPRDTAPHALRVLYVGRFLFWKGMQFGLRAFAELLKKHPGARITLVGEGSDQLRWERLAQDLHIAGQIDWLPWLPQSELPPVYRAHDVLLFPSLHDSGGMVVLEAMSHGLPVICLKLGGPGVMVDASCGRAIDVFDASEAVVVQRLADALMGIAASPNLMLELSQGAVSKAASHSWDSSVCRIYSEIENCSPLVIGRK